MLAKKQTKSDLIDKIYEKTGNELKDIRVIVDLFLDQIKDSLEKQQSVELRGFGTFEVRERKGRKKARNPKTGEIVSVEDHAVVAFRSGKELKNTVWTLAISKTDGKTD